MYLLQTSSVNSLSKENLDYKKSEKISYFNDYIQQKTQILNSLKNNEDVVRFIKTGKNESVVKNLLLSFAYSHNEIFQLRYIDNNGNEIIRIDNYSKPVIVHNSKLQNKKSRYYFEDIQL